MLKCILPTALLVELTEAHRQAIEVHDDTYRDHSGSIRIRLPVVPRELLTP